MKEYLKLLGLIVIIVALVYGISFNLGGNKMPVKQGDKVKIEYKGTLDNGTVFDSSEGREPLEFEVGAGQVIPGFEKAVIDMEKGQEKEIHIPVEEAYGQHKDDLIKDFPRENLPKEQEPQVGMSLMMTLQTGQQVPAKIIEVNETSVKLDLNHPLAGKALNFHIKVVDIS